MDDADGGPDDLGEEMGISVITAMKWIPKSFLLEKPIIYELSKEEMEMAEAAAASGQQGAVAAARALAGAGDDDDEDEQEDNADMHEEEEAEEEETEQKPSTKDDDEDEDMDPALPLAQLRDMRLNEDRLDMEEDDDEADLGSDVEDHCYNPSDRVLVTATVEDDQASLEIHTYDVQNGSFFVHHDIALPSYPLCIEWLGVKGKELNWTETESQSFLAVGSFVPHIEIWSLDVLDALEPNAKLEGHKDAVMCLAWNSSHPHLLASGGADNLVKVWDLQTSHCGRSFNKVHKDKVQSMAWNPAEPTVLLTGSFDRTICVFDAREPDKIARYPVAETDVECCVWDIHNPAVFGLSTEGGVVTFVDVRLGPSGQPLLSFQAHEKACSSLSGNARVPGLYATASADKTVKLWDLQQELLSSSSAASNAQASSSKKKSSSKKSSIIMTDKKPIATRKMKVGKLFSCQFASNADVPEGDLDQDPFLLAAGGSKGSVALWHAGGVEDDEEDIRFKQCFENRVLPSPKVWGAGA